MYHAKELTVSTRGRGFIDITGEVQRAVTESGARQGLCTVFLHHTSASLLLCENADPDVRRDLESFFSRLVKDGDPLFVHDAEGPDDMPAHGAHAELAEHPREGRLGGPGHLAGSLRLGAPHVTASATRLGHGNR